MANQSQVTLGKVVGAKSGPHPLLQITGVDGVSQQTVTMLLPPGMTARPAVGADLVLLEVLGSSDHVVAIGGARAGQGVGDLAPGEFGFSSGGQTIIVRSDHIQIVSPTKVRIETPLLECTGKIVSLCDGASVTLDTHLHGGGPAPDPNT